MIKLKRILIVGGTNGIGYMLSKKFSEKGYEVIAVGRKIRLPKLKNVKYLFVDLLSKKNFKLFLLKLKKIGYFNLVIHCIGGSNGLRNLDYNTIFYLWNFNCGIIIKINKYLIENKLLQKKTQLIHLSSKSTENMSGSAPYVLSKMYLEKYTSLLSENLRKKEIAVNCLKLGIVALPNNNWFKCKRDNIKKYKRNIQIHNSNKEIKSHEIFNKIFNLFKSKDFKTGKILKI